MKYEMLTKFEVNNLVWLVNTNLHFQLIMLKFHAIMLHDRD